MDWIDEIYAKQKRKNKILISKGSALLADLKTMIEASDHRALVLWALELAAESVTGLKAKYPAETRPEQALQAATDWAAGRIKMPQAQAAILACHALAKELTDAADIADCHAIAQASSVVHTKGHALGYPLYDLTAIFHRADQKNCKDAISRRVDLYKKRLSYWQTQNLQKGYTWAGFLQK
jgi:hypothetical protein